MPSVAMILEILNPNVNPLIHTAAYTTNIPITVSPANHNKTAIDILFFIELINSLV